MGGDDHGEAYTAIVQGGRLSRESSNIAEAEAFSVAEGNMCGTVMRGADALPRSKTPSRTKGYVGTWEIPRSASGGNGQGATGRDSAHAVRAHVARHGRGLVVHADCPN